MAAERLKDSNLRFKKMTDVQLQIIQDGLSACVFLLGFIAGLVFFSLFARRWFF